MCERVFEKKSIIETSKFGAHYGEGNPFFITYLQPQDSQEALNARYQYMKPIISKGHSNETFGFFSGG